MSAQQPPPEPSLFTPRRPAPVVDEGLRWPEPSGSRPAMPRGRRRPMVAGFPLGIVVLGVLLGVISVLALIAAGVPAPWAVEPTDRVAPAAAPVIQSLAAPETSATPTVGGARPSRAARADLPGDGVLTVGSDVTPGRYRATEASNGCRWVRFGRRQAVDQTRRVLDSGTGDVAPEVTIGPTDVLFRTTGCKSWMRL